MPDEETQEQGRDGVIFTRRWLEATTFIELPWNAYENKKLCVLPLLKSGRKKYDLRGRFLHESRHEIYVENKAANVASNQTADFREFLANAYSTTARKWADLDGDPEIEYIFVTSYPFGRLADWGRLHTKEAVIKAVEDEEVLPTGTSLDDSLAALVSERCWLLVVHAKQERITLDQPELEVALRALERKKHTL
ncbi:hypothetical protein [Clavibacter michiganensis]|uniref:hypothetical protein n=1 Tax=Clavibacter michiganensis TaxID=28447 RepID=UPI000FFB61F7|nr:hypothetical protein [Clavibacter michiganensis]MBF4638962.1 hypothetical protein [Clavibacter michiganensis subsp. michiganensis]MBW8027502.1 hypothetical protein [Clavibacter michiganensis subsp. michiganensis]MDO4028351.1 hypothetical protein [Clavibacter michiganensis]MDO4044329.1 hypothetical protein [Clavibacter michiganensis]MDO4053348.1 hypothetical protein [Clavibacter michiganensis]